MEKIKIDSLSFGEGYGVGRSEGKVVFVPYGVPGDVVTVEITEEKKRYSIGKIIDIEEKSPLRIEAACRYFGECGGCQWLNIGYGDELEWKEKLVRETLERLGGVECGEIEVFRSPKELGYRARATFHRHEGKLGYHKRSSNEIVEIDSCPLLCEELNATLEELRAMKIPREVTTIEVAHLGGSVGVVFNAKELKGGFKPEPTGSISGVKVITKNRAGRKKVLWKSGEQELKQDVFGVTVITSLGSFMQGNTELNEVLVGYVTEEAGEDKEALAIDLFSGSGNFALTLAKKFKKVTAVESDSASVVVGRKGLALAGLENVKFITGNAYKDEFYDKCKDLEKDAPAVVILDPPRGGADAALEKAAGLAPEKIIYVSCNPSTLARDLRRLPELGLKIDKIALFDMFPRTFHVETVVSISRA
ncbi:MAG: class I SAM-dependent RNA methyltransferase [Deltaproteobacteria bacterium]|nr:class I SAM-dependent RNA methyltransferase [Deltaproteobacteria bacterium]